MWTDRVWLRIQPPRIVSVLMVAPEQILALAGAIAGSGSAVAILARGLVHWASGAAGRERARNQDLLAQRNDAWNRTEYERSRADEAERSERAAHALKRRALELASHYRAMLIERGLDPGPWPEDLSDH